MMAITAIANNLSSVRTFCIYFATRRMCDKILAKSQDLRDKPKKNWCHERNDFQTSSILSVKKMTLWNSHVQIKYGV
jgi:hypothetical protein